LKGEPVLKYFRDIKDYVSDVQVIQDGKVVAAKKIEVNKPLHWGGYYFYQHSYDDKAGRYTILSISSDSGILIVYAGYAALCLGIIGRLWFSKWTKRKSYIEKGSLNYQPAGDAAAADS
jgi:cytochrome c biogenesis protein ResB